MKRGVFWVIDGELLSFPFSGDAVYGIAGSGKTFNHRLLWDHVRPRKCRKPFDYYPRGRVEISGKGKPLIYMSPWVPAELIPQIRIAFELDEEPAIHVDGSVHYQCQMDRDGKKGESK